MHCHQFVVDSSDHDETVDSTEDRVDFLQQRPAHQAARQDLHIAAVGFPRIEHPLGVRREQPFAGKIKLKKMRRDAPTRSKTKRKADRLDVALPGHANSGRPLSGS